MQLSKAQDVEAGDGTTSVVVIAGSLLDACERLLAKGIHPAVISESFGKASSKACEILEKVIVASFTFFSVIMAFKVPRAVLMLLLETKCGSRT